MHFWLRMLPQIAQYCQRLALNVFTAYRSQRLLGWKSSSGWTTATDQSMQKKGKQSVGGERKRLQTVQAHARHERAREIGSAARY